MIRGREPEVKKLANVQDSNVEDLDPIGILKPALCGLNSAFRTNTLGHDVDLVIEGARSAID